MSADALEWGYRRRAFEHRESVKTRNRNVELVVALDIGGREVVLLSDAKLAQSMGQAHSLASVQL